MQNRVSDDDVVLGVHFKHCSLETCVHQLQILHAHKLQLHSAFRFPYYTITIAATTACIAFNFVPTAVIGARFQRNIYRSLIPSQMWSRQFRRVAHLMKDTHTHTHTAQHTLDSRWMCGCEQKRDVNWFPVCRKLFGHSIPDDLVCSISLPFRLAVIVTSVGAHACARTHESPENNNKKFRAKRRRQMTIFRVEFEFGKLKL